MKLIMEMFVEIPSNGITYNNSFNLEPSSIILHNDDIRVENRAAGDAWEMTMTA